MTKEAKEAISLNISANFIGIGNAATIYGIKGVEELKKISVDKTKASDNMVLFVLMNSASMQFIPASIIMLRAIYLSKDASSIVPAVWIVTAASLCVGIFSAKILNKIMK